MDEVRQRLQQVKQENQELEKELRQNSTAEQKAKLLEVKVSENYDTISHLRQERTHISKEHKDLQKRYSELSETVSKLREKHATQSTSHDTWRHKLDLQVLEIEELKQALDSRSSQLQKAQREKELIASENEGVAKSVASLEADLRRVRRDAEAFGRDLKALRSEKEKLEGRLKEEVAKGERTKKQNETKVRVLNEQLESQKMRAAKALQGWENHVCAADESQVSELKLRHNKECKGLMVQIRYLKAKFTRESSFREDLVYQKEYLLVLLAQFKKSERTIFATIAKIGFPVAPGTPRRKRSLKSVAMIIVFLNRVKRGSVQWQEQRTARTAISAALDEVHRRRALASS
ncbi:Pericentrin-AKAP-450 domain of centrosomal targeting protein-domain-containing protein [Ephemerocybe angulata]|uniref:Pericentrin-AKAP-450 domain of centrosomal targeting protein-domain-containing protein n=1 Tax=Ephemerocybe angulata TaxID=980116 RepID=A0A8H6IA41_9AGAR|nr:Pericentrin-AKAP-450 domain of centrosomal targeting protein-domain-containing protein [Tulosesus angulatus]